MSEHKSHKVKIENILPEKAKIKLGSKNRTYVIAAWLFVLMLALAKLWILVIFAGFYAFIYSFGDDKKIFEGNSKFFVVYNDQNNIYADVIYLSEVEGWEYRITNTKDKMIFYLYDMEKYRIEENVDRRMYGYFREVLPEKEIRRKKES